MRLVFPSLSATRKIPLSTTIDIDSGSNPIQRDRNAGLIAYISCYDRPDLRRLEVQARILCGQPPPRSVTCPRTGRAKYRAAGRDQVDLRLACVINSSDFTGETIVKAVSLTRSSWAICQSRHVWLPSPEIKSCNKIKNSKSKSILI